MKRRDFIAGWVGAPLVAPRGTTVRSSGGTPAAPALVAPPGAADPIRIGWHRQLFVDDSRIASVEGLARRFHPPEHYRGANLPHDGSAVARAEQGWVENGERIQRAIGLATLRLDGFASLDAGRQQGVLLTRRIEAPGGSLLVNADVRGELRVEVLDGEGRALPGHAAAECTPVRSDGLRHAVRWLRRPDLEPLRGKPVTLCFLLRDASLYSFGFRNEGSRS